MDPISIGLMAGGSILSAAIGSRDAKKARKIQQEAIALQRAQLKFAKQRYADNEALYGQTKRDLVDMANEGVKADLQGVTDRASGDVAQAFQKSQDEADRNLARYGINPNSGRAIAAKQGMDVAKAAAEAGLINTSRRDEKRYADETTWNRRNDVARLGVQELQFDANNVNSATQGLSNAYTNQAGMYQQSANAAYGLAGNLAGMGLYGYMNKTKPGSNPSQPTYMLKSSVNTAPASRPLIQSSPYTAGIFNIPQF
jgi:hypothetical protein